MFGRIKRWLKVSWLQVWPHDQPEADLNPDTVFDAYQRTVEDLETQGPSNESETLFGMSKYIFETENDRRASIDARASVLIGASGITGTVVAGIGGGLLSELAGDLSAGRIIVLALYLATLLYLVSAIIAALSVHGPMVRHTIGPDDLHTMSGVNRNFQHRLSLQLISYTIENYKVNNRQMVALAVAQSRFRNAVITIILAGLILPFA